MAKILFCFAGTFDDGERYSEKMEMNQDFNSDVIRVYLRGCQHKKVGGGVIFPNLDIAAEKISKAFNDNQSINLEKLKEELGSAICFMVPKEGLSGDTKIERIGLQGFSRGAITAFAVARKLDKFNIPMDIMANQPVPGLKSMYTKYCDLSACKNITTATTLLASHHLQNGYIQNKFHRQMVAKFPATVKVSHWLIPHQWHMQWEDYNLVTYHLSHQFSQNGYKKNQEIMSDIKIEYQKGLYFTPPEFSQEIYGVADIRRLDKDPFYLQMMHATAEALFNKLKIQLPEKISHEFSEAIYNLCANGNVDDEEKENYINFILKKPASSSLFIEIINQVCSVNQYLVGVAQESSGNKSLKIHLHRGIYEKALFDATHQYLSQEIDQKTFLSSIHEAQYEFEKNALNIDRNILHKAFKVVVNFILKITGIKKLLQNPNDYRYTYSPTDSTQISRHFTQQVKAMTASEKAQDVDDANRAPTPHTTNR